MKKIFYFSMVLFFSLGFAACSSNEKIVEIEKEKPRAAELLTLNWDSFNKSKIEDLINGYGKYSTSYNAQKPPYVVFDWDNTSVFLDIEEASLIYQIQNLAFGATPAQLNEAIRKDIAVKNFLGDYKNLAGEAINIEKIAPDIVESYTWLYNNYKGLHGDKTLAEVSASPHFMAFASKLRFLYDAIGETFDHAVSYPWVTYLFVGMTETQVRDLTRKTVEWQVLQPVTKVKWETPAELPGQAGCVSVSWKNGLRLVPEMQNLYALFREFGFDVYVCSASFVDVIKEISSNPNFGYKNKAENVLAMELERDGGGKIKVQFRAGYDQTQGAGKSAAIKRFLVSKYGYGPLFIAGDSEGDQNMMQDFADTKLVLIVNRLRSASSDIGKFSKTATETYNKPAAKYLLQGRNDNTGLFIPQQGSYAYGSNTAVVLK